MDYNCTYINGTHFNSTIPCDDYNDYYGIYDIFIYFFLMLGIVWCVCFPRACCGDSRSSYRIGRAMIRQEIIIVQGLENLLLYVSILMEMILL